LGRIVIHAFSAPPTLSTRDVPAQAVAHPRDALAVHQQHADFVWRSLQRLGVRPNDLDDVFQEVFLVVHKRLATFDGSSLLVTWLHGICVRVVAGHRRRAWFRRETPSADPFELDGGGPSEMPDDAYAVCQARATLARVLDAMDMEKRAVFVMFEVDELTCDEIAAILGVPVGTVWSRLSAARKHFQAKLAREARLPSRARRGTFALHSEAKGGLS
jgi:RNA polymerase sigma-70 factor (ECF subfamily)